MRTLIVLLLVLHFFSIGAFSQSSQNSDRKESTDSTNDVIISIEFADRNPTIALFYGSAMPSRDGITSAMGKNQVFGGTLGMEREHAWWRDGNIVIRNAKNLCLWYGASAVATTSVASSANLFRVGITDESGFGYTLGATSNVTFLASSGVLSWTVVTPQAIPSDVASAQSLRDFEGSLRFGEVMRPSIDFRITNGLSLRAGFEWSQIYPRHMFWYWGVSQAIEGIADAGATWFAKEIGKSSPGAMPIVYFLLKNGVAAGFKLLRMNQMNWPFTTVAPLNVYQWNIGANIHF